MRLTIHALLILTICSCSYNEPEETVRGELFVDSSKQTITECDTKKVYEVRAPDNLSFIWVKVDQLSSSKDREIIAEFIGPIMRGKTSLEPSYPVDGTMIVLQVISIEQGKCD